MRNVRIEDVREYWDKNPLCASAIPHPLGSPEFFEYYNRLREANEPLDFQERLHEYSRFSGKRVLDVGCGNGYILSRYALAGAHVSGVDITPTGVRLSRSRFAQMGLEGDIREANAEQLPFQDESFDCVCSMGVLHHTPDMSSAIREIHRVLKPGGRLIIMLYHRNSLLYRLTFGLERLLKGKPLRQSVDDVDGCGNPKGEVFSQSEVKSLLAPGFTDVKTFLGLLQWWMLPRFTHGWFKDAFLKKFERWLGWFVYAKAYKAPGAWKS